METPHLYINQYLKTHYLCFSNQIEFDLKNRNHTPSFVLKQSFGIFDLLSRKAKNLYRRGCDFTIAFNQNSKQRPF